MSYQALPKYKHLPLDAQVKVLEKHIEALEGALEGAQRIVATIRAEASHVEKEPSNEHP